TPYINRDIIPLPPSRQTWSKKVFVFFWLATSINIAEWSGASASLALGLTVSQAIIGETLDVITAALVISGYGGGQWHVPFVRHTLPFSISSLTLSRQLSIVHLGDCKFQPCLLFSASSLSVSQAGLVVSAP
ncbi:hypothetical protein CY34DRAFT_87047, partial [Suillus luteus UH-Slu-Lm8-n1]